VRNLKGEVYKIIKDGIRNRSLQPGTQLKESDLVEALGVSRTPIREAINQLSKEGIIEIIPRRGAFVKRFTEDEVIEVLLLREVLEGLATRIAASKLNLKQIQRIEALMDNFRPEKDDYAQTDEKFHQEIVQACGSERVIGMVSNLNDNLQMLGMRKVIFRSPARIKDSIAEHRKIIEALKVGDEYLAEQATREHFQITRSYYLNQLK